LNRRLAFIDHSFHKKTRSSDFFLEILKERYEVDLYYDGFWDDEEVFDFNILNTKKYDIVLFWQVNYSVVYLDKITCKNIIYIPMYDDFISNTLTPFYWKQFSHVKFISFSKTLHKYLSNKGLDSFYIQYFPEQKKLPKKEKECFSAFFWYRIEHINWESIKSIIDTNSFETVYIQNNPDPNQKKLDISKKDIEDYNIKFIDWFKDKEEYLKFLDSVDVYFAPREYEGIGLSFLEAMSYGKIVVALNKPTMNEYIMDGKNGFLFEKNGEQKIDFSKIDLKIMEKYNKIFSKGYQKRLNELFPFIEKEVEDKNIYYKDFFFFFLDKILYFPFKIYKK